jgi:hypothetical protein
VRVQVFRGVMLCCGVNGYRSIKIVLPLPEFISHKELWVKVKVKFTLEQATKAQRVSRYIDPLFL